MIPTKKQVLKEADKMQNWVKENYKKDIITARMVYAMAEIMRWCVEDTKYWGSPLKQGKSNAKILKKEIGIIE